VVVDSRGMESRFAQNPPHHVRKVGWPVSGPLKRLASWVVPGHVPGEQSELNCTGLNAFEVVLSIGIGTAEPQVGVYLRQEFLLEEDASSKILGSVAVAFGAHG